MAQPAARLEATASTSTITSGRAAVDFTLLASSRRARGGSGDPKVPRQGGPGGGRDRGRRLGAPGRRDPLDAHEEEGDQEDRDRCGGGHADDDDGPEDAAPSRTRTPRDPEPPAPQ